MTQIFFPRPFHVNSAGRPYALAKLYHYRANTTTLLDLYTDSTLNTPHAQPVVADANGIFPPLYLDPTDGYDLRLILHTSADVLLWDEDDIPRSETLFSGISVDGNITATGSIGAGGAITTTGNITLTSGTPRVLFNENDAITDKKIWDIGAGGTFFAIRTRSDADGAGSDILSVLRGSGTAISSIILGNSTDAPSVSINGTSVKPQLNSFTATLTGMSGATTGTLNYSAIGAHATLYAQAAITGTSNATTFTLTGLPSAMRPSGTRIVPCVLTDNGANGLGWATFTAASGTVTFNFGTALGAFTNSGTKGLPTGCTITYLL